MKKLELSQEALAELTQLYSAGDYAKFNHRVATLSGKIKIGVVLDELLAAAQRLQEYRAKYHNDLGSLYEVLESDPARIQENPDLAYDNHIAEINFKLNHPEYYKDRALADWALKTLSHESRNYSDGFRVFVVYTDDETNKPDGRYRVTEKDLANYLQVMFGFTVSEAAYAEDRAAGFPDITNPLNRNISDGADKSEVDTTGRGNRFPVG